MVYELPIILACLFGLCLALLIFCIVALCVAAIIKREKDKEKAIAQEDLKADKRKPEVIKYKLIQHKSKKVPIPAIEGLIKNEPPPPPPPPEPEPAPIIPVTIDDKP